MTQNLVVQTTVSSGIGGTTEQVGARYTAGQTINQLITLVPGKQFTSATGFSSLVLTPSGGPIQLVAAKGANATYMSQTVNQQLTVDDSVDSFKITNPSTTVTVAVRIILVVPS